jgi:dTDP-glucose 4,6-dehydratase
MSDTVIVAGGAGFIGANFVRHLLACLDFRVVVADKLTYAGNLASLADIRSPRFVFEQLDICDIGALQGLYARYPPRWVVNFAAESHVDRSIDGPRAFVMTNVVGAFELLEASRRHWTGLAGASRDAFRHLHVSTDEVFGSLGPTGAFSEETAYSPNSPYAASKAGADHLVRAYRETFGMPVLLTNCSNNYGPFQFPEKLLPLMILNANEGRSLPIYGDGQNVRDWLFVEDHCSALLRVLENGQPGARYNVGGEAERTNLALVDALCDTLERVSPARENPALRDRGLHSYAELKTFVPDRPGHDRRYAIDARKLRRELGWAPRHSLEGGLELTVRWYLEHADWCHTVQRDKFGRERLGLAAVAGGSK